MTQTKDEFISSWKKGLKRSYIQMLIIYTIFIEENCTGYVVTEQIKNRLGNDTFKISAGTIYPQLNRLEKDGIIFSEIKIIHSAEIRPSEARKIFNLTEEGKKLLDRIKRFWVELVTTVNSYLLDMNEITKENRND